MTKKAKTLRAYKWEEEFRRTRQDFARKYRADQLSQTTLEQRKTFIECLRASDMFGWNDAMKSAGISDHLVAYAVYMKNSRPIKSRRLVDPEKVR